MIAYVGVDHLIRLEEAQTTNLTTGVKEYLGASATVQVTVLDSAGAQVVGETWPVTLSYVTGSSGVFLGVLRNEVTLVEGETYTLRAEVNNGNNQYRKWDLPLIAMLGR